MAHVRVRLLGSFEGPRTSAGGRACVVACGDDHGKNAEQQLGGRGRGRASLLFEDGHEVVVLWAIGVSNSVKSL